MGILNWLLTTVYTTFGMINTKNRTINIPEIQRKTRVSNSSLLVLWGGTWEQHKRSRSQIPPDNTIVEVLGAIVFLCTLKRQFT